MAAWQTVQLGATDIRRGPLVGRVNCEKGGNNMSEGISGHYRGGGGLVARIARDLRDAGIEPSTLRASDF